MRRNGHASERGCGHRKGRGAYDGPVDAVTRYRTSKLKRIAAYSASQAHPKRSRDVRLKTHIDAGRTFCRAKLKCRALARSDDHHGVRRVRIQIFPNHHARFGPIAGVLYGNDARSDRYIATFDGSIDKMKAVGWVPDVMSAADDGEAITRERGRALHLKRSVGVSLDGNVFLQPLAEWIAQALLEEAIDDELL